MRELCFVFGHNSLTTHTLTSCCTHPARPVWPVRRRRPHGWWRALGCRPRPSVWTPSARGCSGHPPPGTRSVGCRTPRSRPWTTWCPAEACRWCHTRTPPAGARDSQAKDSCQGHWDRLKILPHSRSVTRCTAMSAAGGPSEAVPSATVANTQGNILTIPKYFSWYHIALFSRLRKKSKFLTNWHFYNYIHINGFEIQNHPVINVRRAWKKINEKNNCMKKGALTFC